MSLFEIYKTESFPNQYYEISRVPFVVMGIEPYSELAESIKCYIEDDIIGFFTVSSGSHVKKWLSCFLYDCQTLGDGTGVDAPPFFTCDDDGYSGICIYELMVEEEDFKEFSILANEYLRIEHEIAHNDLTIKHAVNGLIPTEKILKFGNPNKKTPPIEQRAGSRPANPNRSERLAALQQASEQFWINAHRDEKDTWPVTKDIVSWLKEKGLTQSLAESAATIIRPEWAGSGRISGK
ncbi:MAG: hypothetical protein QX196_07675 [Methylococcaceae bacterium]